MRLNFSASKPDEIQEGIRRIGAVISEQVELYESITGEHRILVPRLTPARPEASRGRWPGQVLPFQAAS